MANKKADTTSTLNVVGVGASARGVEAPTSFTAGLPAELPCAIVIALHMPAGAPSVLARILDRRSALPAVIATPGAQLEHGTAYVGTPDHHLLAHDGQIVLPEGPTENGHRPAINALFRSVALAYGQRAIGVLLSAGSRRRGTGIGGYPLTRRHNKRPITGGRIVFRDTAKRDRRRGSQPAGARCRDGRPAQAAHRSGVRRLAAAYGRRDQLP